MVINRTNKFNNCLMFSKFFYILIFMSVIQKQKQYCKKNNDKYKY